MKKRICILSLAALIGAGLIMSAASALPSAGAQSAAARTLKVTLLGTAAGNRGAI
jgi:amino acid permease